MRGDELKERRDTLGMTQGQLASALGVSANTVARWERGERTIPPHLTLALDTVERQYKPPKRPGKKKGGEK